MRHRFRRWLVKVIPRYALAWYAITALIYLSAIPLTVLLFPRTTLTLSIIVLVGSFTSSVASLASVVMTAEDQD